MAHPDVTTDYTSGSSADTTSFTANAPARWIYAYGAGDIVVKDNADTPATKTYTVVGGDVITGEWSAFTSTTCSRIRMGTTSVAPSGTPAATAITPGTSIQAYADGGAALSAAFNAAIGYMYLINPSGATFAYTLPAISASNNGMKIAVVNVSTGSTATVAAPTGSDNVGNCAGASTGATAAGPTGGAVKVYTANDTVKAWLVGI
jgi:hypothetical protein